jgi:hypothetical protein
MTCFLCFGVGFNNFGSGRVHFADVIQVLNGLQADLVVVASFGATGNLAVVSRSLPATGIASTLANKTGREWAVLEVGRVVEALARLDAWVAPRNRPGIRWTPGLAFAIAGTGAGEVASTHRGCYRRVESGVMAVYKRDVLDGPRLDPRRRQGGWGGISADIGGQLGGTWTARSHRPVRGLIARSQVATGAR